jgi:uncharacterized protein YdhG (YjbR/CyaY superfamily)
MTAKRDKFDSIDEYIAGFPKETQQILEQIRITIKRAAPMAMETIKYEMPAFTLKGNLIYFAAFKNHIGMYPVPTGDEAFNNEISQYKRAKSTVRFPLDRPIPYELITRMVKFRISESRLKAEKRK